MKKKEPIINNNNKKEIFYNIINALMAGAISFFSALLAVDYITKEIIIVSVLTAALIFTLRCKDYWDGEKKEYCKIINFI